MSKRSASETIVGDESTTKKVKNESNSTNAEFPARHAEKPTHAHHGPLTLIARGDEKYLPGFDSDHQSEALPHALPIGQNSPQVSDRQSDKIWLGKEMSDSGRNMQHHSRQHLTSHSLLISFHWTDVHMVSSPSNCLVLVLRLLVKTIKRRGSIVFVQVSVIHHFKRSMVRHPRSLRSSWLAILRRLTSRRTNFVGAHSQWPIARTRSTSFKDSRHWREQALQIPRRVWRSIFTLVTRAWSTRASRIATVTC